MPSLQTLTRARLKTAALLIALSCAQAPSIYAEPAQTPLIASCSAPVLDLFNPSPGDTVPPGNYVISGVAIDPMATQGSGIDEVSFFLDNRDQGGMLLGSVMPLGGPRLDDFSLSIDLPSSGQGEHQLVAYAHSALTGRETQVSVPIQLGTHRDGNATPPPMSNTNPGTLPETCAAAMPNVFVTPESPLTGGGALSAQANPAVQENALFGTVIGEISVCQNGAQQPLTGVTVTAQGTQAATTSDSLGAFSLGRIPAPGVYTITASNGGSNATRQYVPVAPGETIDIGTLEFGVDLNGCADEQ
jgi:hypothetical protein